MKLELQLQHGELNVNTDDVISNPLLITIDFKQVLKGDKGDKGYKGDKGDKGEWADFSILKAKESIVGNERIPVSESEFITPTGIASLNNAALGLKANKDLSNVSFDNKSLVGAIISDAKVSKLLTSNGYYKAPDGLMLQWGTISTSSGSGTAIFPLAFNTVFSIATSMQTDTSNYAQVANYETLSYNSFGWRKRDIGPSAVGASGMPFKYIAIGTWK